MALPMDLLNLLARLFDPVQMATGLTEQELNAEAPDTQFAGLNIGQRPDLPVHALATQRATERFGAPIALGLGLGKETATGLFNLFEGKSFLGPTGFDVEDLRANLAGAAQADEIGMLLQRLFGGE